MVFAKEHTGTWLSAIRMVSVLLFLGLFLPVVSTAAQQSWKVGEILVKGNNRVDPARIRAVIGAEAGSEVSIEQIDQDIHSIYDIGNFSQIEVEIEPVGDTSTLVYRVMERPLVRMVRFRGNDKIKRKALREAIHIKTPSLYMPDIVKQAEEDMRNLYAEKGFYAVTIDSEAKISVMNEATLIFQIDEGKKVGVSRIQIDGNAALTDKELKKEMVTTEKWMFSWLTGSGKYSAEALEMDTKIISDAYFNAGYLQVDVKQPLVKVSEDRESVEIFIEIEEGEPFNVGSLEFAGVDDGDLEKIKSRLKLLSLTRFNRKQLRADIRMINDFFADQGYAYVNVSPLTRLDTERHRINILYDVEPGDKISVDRITISGNMKTRDKIIRREMLLREGDLFSSTRMKESQRRVNNLGFFELVHMNKKPGIREDLMDVDVVVKEKPTGTFTIGFGYSSVDKLVGQGSISQNNFLGQAWRLNLSGSFGSTSSTYQIGIYDPHFSRQPFCVGI